MENKYFTYIDNGRISYKKALFQQTEAFDRLLEAKKEGRIGENILFFCEHNPVITIGKSGKESNLLVDANKLAMSGIELFRVNRGGDITYHGPGQITGYPVFDLENWQMGLREYVFILEEIVISFLKLYGLKAGRLEGATGVWLEPENAGRARKICAIGVRSSRYVTMHGFALNINTDLSHFSYMNPCGFADKGVTSLARELGSEQDFMLVKEQLRTIFRQFFE